MSEAVRIATRRSHVRTLLPGRWGATGTGLQDISQHPSFTSDGRPGTFGNGTKSGKFDYILLSPNLFQRVQAAGVWRKGVWGGKNGTLWPIYAEMKRQNQQASDHAAIYADINL